MRRVLLDRVNLELPIASKRGCFKICFMRVLVMRVKLL